MRRVMKEDKMLRFVAIDPRRASVELVTARELTDVYQKVGINRSEVDHGCILLSPETGETINVVVYEAGLFKGEEGRYFSIGNQLYEGGAVLYAADYKGDTISITSKPPVIFYRDASEVERAIAVGEVRRPVRAFGGEVTWMWPEVRDFHMTERESKLMVEVIKEGDL